MKKTELEDKWTQESHRQDMFLMTMSCPELDPQPSNMRWTVQGRPSTQPHVRSAQETRQGFFWGFFIHKIVEQ